MNRGNGYLDHFDRDADTVWLDTAHQGVLPLRGVAELEEAVGWKRRPERLDDEAFFSVPARLRAALARLIGADEDDVALANSASYGLHLLANGMPLEEGDEVLVLDGDFPSDILPWVGLERRGVRLRRIVPRDGPIVQPHDLSAAIGPNTRLFCTTWVHSFSGWTADLEALGEICRRHRVWFVVNASQGIGARPIDAASLPVDAITCVGFKWLCGPYGTGFLYMRPELSGTLQVNREYWLARLERGGDLTAAQSSAPPREAGAPVPAPGAGPAEPRGRRAIVGARRHDVFGTANFFNYVPWTAAVELLLELGPERVAAHDQRLVERLVEGVDGSRYRVTSPTSGRARSTLVFVTHREPRRNASIADRLRAGGVHVSLRSGRLRLSPHLHNDDADIDRALGELARLG